MWLQASLCISPKMVSSYLADHANKATPAKLYRAGTGWLRDTHHNPSLNFSHLLLRWDKRIRQQWITSMLMILSLSFNILFSIALSHWLRLYLVLCTWPSLSTVCYISSSSRLCLLSPPLWFCLVAEACGFRRAWGVEGPHMDKR